MDLSTSNEIVSFAREISLSPSRRILVPIVMVKVGLLSLALLFAAQWPEVFNKRQFEKHFHWPNEEPPNLCTYFKTWSSMHYLHLCDEWYQQDNPSNFAYPLWPALLRSIPAMSPAARLINALLLTNFLSLLGLFLIHHLTYVRWGNSTADLTCLLILVFPGSIFLELPYSDSLQFCLVAFLFVSLQKSFLPGLLLSCFLLPLVSETGLLLSLPVAIALQQKGKLKTAGLALVAMIAGVLTYLLIFQINCHDATVGLSAQKALLAANGIGFRTPLHFAGGFLSHSSSYRGFPLHDRICFLLFVFVLFHMRRMPSSFIAYSTTVGLSIAFSYSLVGFMREMTTLFPVFIVIARGLAADFSDRVPRLPLVCSACFQILAWLAHTNNYWVG